MVGGTHPASLAAASAMAHWLFCGTPCSRRSHPRTAFWSSGSSPEAWTRATHSCSDRPVRAASDPLTALIMSSGVRGMAGSLAWYPMQSREEIVADAEHTRNGRNFTSAMRNCISASRWLGLDDNCSQA